MSMAMKRSSRGAVIVVATTAALTFAVPALADDHEGFEQPPGYQAPAAPEVDPHAPGLKLGDGATLAEPRLLDIKFVVEDLGTGAVESDTGGDGNGGGGGASEGPSVDGAAESREERTGGQRKFTLQTDVLFGKNSDEVTDESREALRGVAEAIKEQQPEWVNIFGFTDNLGSYDHGVPLSNNRAKNTQQILIDLLDDPSGITFNVRGYSEDYPLYDNGTEEGRQKNRRVEISWPTTG